MYRHGLSANAFKLLIAIVGAPARMNAEPSLSDVGARACFVDYPHENFQNREHECKGIRGGCGVPRAKFADLPGPK